jgi:long-chain fatty acid transport protein
MKTAKNFYHILLLSLALSGIEGSAVAGGFQSGAPTARSLGLGGAGTALIGDQAGVFSNTASLSYMHGTNLALGATVTMPEYQFTGVLPSTSTSKMKPQTMFPPSVSLSHTFESGLGVGISANIPYQIKTSWGEDWVGSPIVISSEIRGVQVSPAVAFRIGKNLAAGLGVQATFMRMDHLRRYGDVPDVQTGIFPTMSMTGSADVAYGFDIGLMYSPGDAFSMGLALKSKTTAEITNGTVTYTGSVGEPSSTSGMNASFATTLTLPERVRAGVMIHPIDALLFTGEVEYTRWAGIKGVTIRLGSPVSIRLIDQSGWKDVLAYRAGAEFTIADVTLRGGFGVEPSPVPDAELRPSIPDASAIHFNVGIGYAVEDGLIIDLGLQVNRYADRTVTDSHVLYATDKYFNGTYAMSSTIFALTLSYSWK